MLSIGFFRRSFDLDKNQAISLENLRAVIGDTYDGSRVEEIMQLCDSNGDGKIDFDEVSLEKTFQKVLLEVLQRLR